jgi:hypothetical protein
MAHLLWITAALVSGAAPAPRRAPALAGARPRLAPA